MSGCDSEALSRLIDGELPVNEARRLREHMETCPKCSAAFANLQELDSLCKEILPRTDFRRATLRPHRRVRLAAMAAAAALLIAGGLTFGALRERLPSPEVRDTSHAEGSNATPGVPTEPEAAQTPAVPGTDENGLAGAADPSLPSGRVFRGTIVNADGEPVAGASVAATGHNAPSTTTTDSGTFELAWNADCAGIRIDRPGYTAQHVNLDGAPPDVDVTAHVLLLKAEIAKGRVVGKDGRPLEGVFVRSTDSSAGTHTAADGSYAVPTQGGVVLSRPGFPETVCNVNEPSSTLVLTPGGSVRVRVVKGRAPVSGVEVRLDSDRSNGCKAHTDADGVAVFENIPPGPFSLAAGEGVDCRVEGTLTVEEGKTVACTLSISEPRAGLVRGRVYDADGAPIAGATVQVYSVDNPATRTTVKTGADGGFESALWPGRNEVVLNGWGLRTRYPGCRVADPRMASVVPDPTRAAYVEFRLERVPMGRVALQNERGEPLRTAAVCWEGFRCAPSGELSIATDDGEIEVPTQVKRVQAYDPVTDRLGAADVEPGRLALLRCDTPAVHLRGRVADRAGNPIPYATVQAHLKGEGLWAPSGCLTQSARDGRFVLGPLAANGSYYISVYCRGYDMAGERWENPIVAHPGMPDMNIVLQPMDAVLEGRVLNADGSLASNVRLEVESGERGFAAFLPAGIFSFDLLPGEYTLTAHARRVGGGDAQSLPVAVSAPKKSLVLRLLDQGAGQTPQGPDYEIAEDTLKQMGIVFKMFASEHSGLYPEISQTPGVFAPDMTAIYPEYVTDGKIVQWVGGRQNARVVYLGYAVTGAEGGMAVLDAYQEYGPEGLAGADIALPEGTSADGLDHVHRMREGVERFFITDIDDPTAGARAQSAIPLMWEMPGAHSESGGFVLFMDGHTEWREYPGEFPMSPEFVERLSGLMAPR